MTISQGFKSIDPGWYTTPEGRVLHGFEFNENGKESKVANFLFVLSQDDNEKATRCFQFAKIAHSKGHEVNIFLIDGGVLWANNERDFMQKTKTEDCPNDYFPYLVEKEVPVGV